MAWILLKIWLFLLRKYWQLSFWLSINMLMRIYILLHYYSTITFSTASWANTSKTLSLTTFIRIFKTFYFIFKFLFPDNWILILFLFLFCFDLRVIFILKFFCQNFLNLLIAIFWRIISNLWLLRLFLFMYSKLERFRLK